MSSKKGYKDTEMGLIPEHWSMKTIGEIGKVIGGGTPSTKNKSYYGGDIPWITPKDLSSHNEVYINRGIRNITKLGLENSSARLMPKGTILFSSRAPIGYVAIANIDITTNQGFKSVICNEKVADNKFIYYALKNYAKAIESIAAGSTFKEVSGKVLKEFQIPLPPLIEQNKIAEILLTIDKKIEINRQMNQNLEGMGSDIFRHWFINYEFPDENSQPYKSSGGKIITSKVGKIPIGWEVGQVGDFIELKYGKGLTKNKRKTGEIPVYGSSGVTDYHDEHLVKGPGIIIGRKGNVGTIYISHSDFWPIDTTYYVKSNKENVFFYWYYLLKKLNIDKMNAHSAVPGLNRNDVYELLVSIPNNIHLLKFENFVTILFNKINHNQIENQLLTSIHNSLLPKLISGKIRVPVELNV